MVKVNRGYRNTAFYIRAVISSRTVKWQHKTNVSCRNSVLLWRNVGRKWKDSRNGSTTTLLLRWTNPRGHHSHFCPNHYHNNHDHRYQNCHYPWWVVQTAQKGYFPLYYPSSPLAESQGNNYNCFFIFLHFRTTRSTSGWLSILLS